MSFVHSLFFYEKFFIYSTFTNSITIRTNSFTFIRISFQQEQNMIYIHIMLPRAWFIYGVLKLFEKNYLLTFYFKHLQHSRGLFCLQITLLYNSIQLDSIIKDIKKRCSDKSIERWIDTIIIKRLFEILVAYEFNKIITWFYINYRLQ